MVAAQMGGLLGYKGRFMICWSLLEKHLGQWSSLSSRLAKKEIFTLFKMLTAGLRALAFADLIDYDCP